MSLMTKIFKTSILGLGKLAYVRKTSVLGLGVQKVKPFFVLNSSGNLGADLIDITVQVTVQSTGHFAGGNSWWQRSDPNNSLRIHAWLVCFKQSKQGACMTTRKTSVFSPRGKPLLWHCMSSSATSRLSPAESFKWRAVKRDTSKAKFLHAEADIYKKKLKFKNQRR